LNRSTFIAAAGVLAVAAVVAAGVAGIALAVRQIAGGKPAPSQADLAALRRVDPNLILCDEVCSFATGFKASRAVALAPDGRLAVSGDSAVRYFDANGGPMGELNVGGPVGAFAFDANGAIFATMVDHVELFAPGGARLASWPSAARKSLLTSIAVAGADVFVADAGARVVLRYDCSGRLLGRIGAKDANADTVGLVVPSPYLDVAMAPDGLLRVVNPGRHRVEAYSRDGHPRAHWGRTAMAIDGFCGCCNPANFAIVPGAGRPGGFEGFVTAEKGLTRVKLYDAEGRFVGVVAGAASFERHDGLLQGKPSDGSYLALDVAADAAGRFFVLDPVLNEVRVFQRNRSSPSARGAAVGPK
jgi:hypothetical protein